MMHLGVRMNVRLRLRRGRSNGNMGRIMWQGMRKRVIHRLRMGVRKKLSGRLGMMRRVLLKGRVCVGVDVRVRDVVHVGREVSDWDEVVRRVRIVIHEVIRRLYLRGAGDGMVMILKRLCRMVFVRE